MGLIKKLFFDEVSRKHYYTRQEVHDEESYVDITLSQVHISYRDYVKFVKKYPKYTIDDLIQEFPDEVFVLEGELHNRKFTEQPTGFLKLEFSETYYLDEVEVIT